MGVARRPSLLLPVSALLCCAVAAPADAATPGGRRTLSITGSPVCGDDAPRTQTMRATPSGRFRVTLAAPRGTTSALVYRIRDARRTVTMPVLVARR